MLGEIIPVEGDVSKKEDIESNIFVALHCCRQLILEYPRIELVATIRAKDKFVNILVNNASVGGVKSDFRTQTNVEDISKTLFASDLDHWNEILQLNTSSIFFTSGN